MPALSVITEPNPLLRKVSEKVENFDKELALFVEDLIDTMRVENGIGIAAIQVGKPIRVLIVDIPINDKSNPYIIINPVVKSLSKETIILDEGCLSVKNDNQESLVYGKVERPISITIGYQDLEGKFKDLAINGTKSDYHLWLARCLQHELDHLDGILFIDKLYPMQNISTKNRTVATKPVK